MVNTYLKKPPKKNNKHQEGRPAKVASIELEAGVLALLAWLACWFGCGMVEELLGMHHCIWGLCNI